MLRDHGVGGLGEGQRTPAPRLLIPLAHEDGVSLRLAQKLPEHGSRERRQREARPMEAGAPTSRPCCPPGQPELLHVLL